LVECGRPGGNPVFSIHGSINYKVKCITIKTKTMNYIIQRTKNLWLIQFISYFFYPVVELWQNAIKSKNPVDFIIWFWVTSLIILFWTGWLTIVFELITNPAQFENATFGIFDTLG